MSSLTESKDLVTPGLYNNQVARDELWLPRLNRTRHSPHFSYFLPWATSFIYIIHPDPAGT